MCGALRTAETVTKQQTHLKFYKLVALPALLCGNICWRTEERDIQRINSVQIRYLRRVKGSSRLDNVKNKYLEINLIEINTA
jgi:hypothetical protein